MQHRGIVLRRRVRLGQQIERLLRHAVDIAAAAHFLERQVIASSAEFHAVLESRRF
jgi:hypothetical protein